MPKLEINLSALKQNYRTLQSKCAPSLCSAVVKADAYGLGIAPVVLALHEEACSLFWVAYAHEAVAVYDVLSSVDIAVFQDFNKETLPLFIQYGFIPVLSSLSQIELYKRYKTQLVEPVIQINTGLNRLGLHERNWALCDMSIRLVMSHLACADANSHFMNEAQLATFERGKAFFKSTKYSLSASDGIFLGDAFHADVVRAGAALYGINTTPYRENMMEPVLTLKARILQISDLKEGAYVGYGATYKTHMPKRIATVSIGYADGFPRALSNRGRLWYKQVELPVVGRVSMDMVTCDITHVEPSLLNEGDWVDVINQHYTIDDLARDSDTIGYELLTRLGARLQRQYL